MPKTFATVAIGYGAFGSKYYLDRAVNGGPWNVTREGLTTQTHCFDSEQEAREYFDTYTTPIVAQGSR